MMNFLKTNKQVVLGILGGGQLAKMLANSAYQLGFNVSIIEKEKSSPAGDMTKQEFVGSWENEEILNQFLESCNIVTLENEFIDPEILDKVAEKRIIFPTAKTIRLIQDKYTQKDILRRAGIKVPDFRAINSVEDALEFAEEKSFPMLIKARKYGYDGYGNATVFSQEECISAIERFKQSNPYRQLMVEEFVDFSKELAVLVARNQSGELAIYPCVETIQYQHICHSVIAPAEISKELCKKALDAATNCVKAIEGVGIFGVELFLTKDNDVLVNEIAPRPHNSGHYTIEACYTSQFENCIRAVLNLPLGSAELIPPAAAMVNLLGTREGSGSPENIEKLLCHKKVWLHLYNKKVSRVGRKMGHITAFGNSQEEAFKLAQAAANAIVW
ncbi:MAG: 5-(carboxyamino)imidazole ribonucleotide synthase [Ignavibacteria bacterium]|jgi:5-(carboxyamino)imidazole ribonucleotide synthase|nr:5-(carboxyamino)imidazole ribonucleotide synthase [Ignavibacteria bacterium]